MKRGSKINPTSKQTLQIKISHCIRPFKLSRTVVPLTNNPAAAAAATADRGQNRCVEVNTQLHCFRVETTDGRNCQLYQMSLCPVLDKLQIYQPMNIRSAYDELSTPAYLACKMGKVCHRQAGKTGRPPHFPIRE